MTAVFKNSIGKKLAMTMMVAVMALVGVLSTGGEKAFAYTNHCTPWFATYNNTDNIICVKDDASNVYVNMEQTGYNGTTTFNWYMELQRTSNGGEVWETIATRTGYINEDSPSSRTFTNVLKTGAYMRVKVTYYGAGTTGGNKVAYTGQWWR